MKKILFLPNGHGEDQTAARIIKFLPSGFDISVYPLVGEGFDFKGLNVSMLGPRKALPGGGFALRNFLSLPKDLSEGLFTLIYSQLRKLRELRGQFDLVVSIGDVVPIIGALLTKTPFIFIGVNKSYYYKSFAFNYTNFEKSLLKKYAKKVYARDKITAEGLKKEGIKAVYEGNPLMDGIQKMSNFQCPISNEGHVVGFLPGTRAEDIVKNLEDFEDIKKELLKLDPSLRFLYAMKNKDRFEDVIYNSDVIVGLSGTGNEQAAGFGKPVVSFVGRGAQYNKKFAHAQKELLGDALSLVKRDPKTVANEIMGILRDPKRREYMAQTGKLRMGEPGACEKIAKDICELLK